jgi:hypothetical protein
LVTEEELPLTDAFVNTVNQLPPQVASTFVELVAQHSDKASLTNILLHVVPIIQAQYPGNEHLTSLTNDAMRVSQAAALAPRECARLRNLAQQYGQVYQEGMVRVTEERIRTVGPEDEYERVVHSITQYPGIYSYTEERNGQLNSLVYTVMIGAARLEYLEGLVDNKYRRIFERPLSDETNARVLRILNGLYGIANIRDQLDSRSIAFNFRHPVTIYRSHPYHPHTVNLHNPHTVNLHHGIDVLKRCI